MKYRQHYNFQIVQTRTSLTSTELQQCIILMKFSEVRQMSFLIAITRGAGGAGSVRDGEGRAVCGEQMYVMVHASPVQS